MTNRRWARSTTCSSHSGKRICWRDSTSIQPRDGIWHHLRDVKGAAETDMKSDFTRVTFDPRNHFSRVLMQQGGVTLDADFNEQAAILLHHLQTMARDLIGPHAAPVH